MRWIAITLASMTFACGNKSFDSLCSKEVPAPPACNTACDPTPGAPNTCPAGFHCSPDGRCDAFCTPTGTECGDGFTCTADGNCVASGTNSAVDAFCPPVSLTPMPTTPSIGLVLDQSGSMFTNLLGNVTRYAAMRDAITGPQGVVTTLESKAYFGSELYTCSGNSPVLTAVPRALDNAVAIRASIDSKIGGTSTPTPVAIDGMVQSFQQNQPPPGSPPIIVLATDGLPNDCSTGLDTQPQSVAAAAAAYAAGIPVYVLSINADNQHFQDLANAGQGHTTGPDIPYYPANNVQQLDDAFETIINSILSCDLTLASAIDADLAMRGILTVNGMMLAYGSDWILVNGNAVRLVGAACTNLKSTANPTIEATFPCGSVIPRTGP